MQLSKTVYFRDYKCSSGRSTGLTIPFSENEADVYRFVEPLSSYSVREILGFELFSELEKAARLAESPTSTFARELLEKNTSRGLQSRDNDKEASLQATFRGGKGSPLHDWYPYLEGYSPDFVTSIINEYAADAKTILDPFCGSGTTALVAAMTGRTGLYAEVNPVCRYIIEAKSKALTLESEEKQRIADRLLETAQRLPQILKGTKQDDRLGASFTATFGKRPFFSAKEYGFVLRLRRIADEASAENASFGVFLTVAILRSLVHGSLLIRRGDLRFRTVEEIQRTPPELMGELVRSIHVVASDIMDASLARGVVRYVCEDARHLDSHVKSVDAVITSPPYLNGTNYFRNTKIELWFLRHLTSKADLRKYRDAAITAGINDVTQKKAGMPTNFDPPALLTDVLRDLRDDAYDQRIPLMVQSYFQEMDQVAASLRKVTRGGASVAIDLGDSCYGSVWVPTDRILAELMERNGFTPEERIVLRERQSRDGRKLGQTLQIFKAQTQNQRKGPKRAVQSGPAQAVLTQWAEFRDSLPHQKGEMAKRNWGHPWHSLCSYQGKLKPSIAHALTKALMPPKTKGRFLDPFSGVGTIPFEARLHGHVAYGFDISPAAVAISKAKLEKVKHKEVRAEMTNLGRWIEERKKCKVDKKALAAIRFNGPLPNYFHPRTLSEIVAARSYFEENKAETGAQALVFSSMLHILHGNRPYALSRRSHPITPFAPTGPTEYRSVMERLENKIERCLAELRSVGSADGRSYYQDATAPWPDEVDELDAIVTSPPFFDSTRFHTANWMRLWFAGWEAEDFTKQPSTFVDERQKKSFEIYDAVFMQASERLKPAGYFAIHLGKSRKCDMAAALSGVGERHLALVDSFAESVSHCESHGIRDKGTVTHHQYLLFQKR